MTTKEINIVECKQCKNKKQKIRSGKFPDNSTMFTDEHGKIWNGRTCPDCHRDKMRYNKSRFELEDLFKEESEDVPDAK